MLTAFARSLAAICHGKSGCLHADGTRITARYGPWVLCGQLIQGRFPKYHDILPSFDGPCWKAKRDEILKALKSCMPFLSDRDRSLKMRMTSDTVYIDANSETQNMSTDVSCVSEIEEDMTICISAQLLIDAIAVMDAEEVSIYIKNARSPIGVIGDNTMLAVVMPVAM
jgi:DNA polymerase-3 subunit beta